MKPETTTRGRQWLIQFSALVVFFIAALMLVSPSATAQQAPAGSVIGNQASATYLDNTATSRTSTSNTVQTTVAQVYAAVLNQSGAKTAPPNQQVCYPHSIVNNGNGVDVFALNTPTMSADTNGTSFAHTGGAYFLDANQDGVPDSGTAITSSGTVAAGATFSFVVCAITPANKPDTSPRLNGDTGTITVTANNSQGGPVTNTQVNTTTIGLAAITVSKQLCTAASVAPACTPVSSGAADTGPYRVILNYTNSGATAADFVRIRDALPLGWVYEVGTGLWSGSGTSLTDASGGDPTGVTNYVYTSGTRTIDANITSVPGSQSGFITFQVRIAAGLPVGASADTTNSATYAYSYQSGSNTICINGSTTTTVSGTGLGNGTFVAGMPNTGGCIGAPGTPASTNNVVYTVVQTAAVSLNGASTTTGQTDSDPVTVFATSPGGATTATSAALGSTIYFTDYVWNRGNGSDTFEVSLRNNAGTVISLSGTNCAVTNTAPDCTFPLNTTFQILQSSGSATLQDSNTNGIPDTGAIPVPTTSDSMGNRTWTCPAPYVVSRNGTVVTVVSAQSVVTSTPTTAEYCGLPIVIAATIPPGATPGTNSGAGFSVRVRAVSAFSGATFDDALNRLTTILGNYVDLTNNKSTSTAMFTQPSGEVVDTTTTPTIGGGNALVGGVSDMPAGDGFGSSGNKIVRSTAVTPSTSVATTVRFTLVVNNTGASAGVYDLTSSYVNHTMSPSDPAQSTGAGLPATVTAGVLPNGWSVAFKANAAIANDCSSVGATLTSTSSIPSKGNQVVCAEITVPATTTSNLPTQPTTVPPGNYDFEFTATLQGTSVSNSLRDRVVVNSVRSVTITPNGSQSTVPGGAVTYNHVVTNNGNVSEPITFAMGFLANNQTPTYAWSTSAFVDNGSSAGILDGTDAAITAGTTPFTLAPNGTQTIFVRVFAPASAGSPPNTTTVTATYNTSSTAVATDLTTLTAGLLLEKYQRLAACGTALAIPSLTAGVPPSPWTKSAITASTAGTVGDGSGTRPGDCIAYLVVATNTTGNNITNISISDAIPSNTRLHLACSPNGGAAAADYGSPGYPGAAIYANAFTGTMNISGAGPLAPSSTAQMQFCVRINP